jgi:CheY-like chemotaxis protein
VPDSPPNAKTIFVIEDNFGAREGLAALIKGHGYQTVTAQDGAVALAMLASWVKPDLIVLDMVLPHLDGWCFLDALRQTVHREVPVIITTATNLTPEWADEHGCVGVLNKPFELDDLLVEIRREFAGALATR